MYEWDLSQPYSEGRLINLQAMHLFISLIAINYKSTDN